MQAAIICGSRLVGTLLVDSQTVGNLQEDNQAVVGNLDRDVGIQRWEDMADQSETSAELEALPSAEAQTCHLACPIQPCVASA